MDGSTSWTIVAVPKKDDYVWNISSEKVPHMSLLFLGEGHDDSLITPIADFLKHVVDVSMLQFGMDVDKRGILGPNEADVLFFNKRMAKNIADIRTQMLHNDAIKRLYDSTEQYPEWTPHLTLGYPETPAKPDKRDYPGITWVNFDTIEFWTGDYEGVSFQLPSYDSEVASMSDDLDEVLAHHGVKGMKWGVRRSASELASARKEKKATKASDKARPTSADAVKAGTHARVAKNAGTSKLSNKEMQELITRMNLEQQYHRLTPPTKGQKAKKMLSDILINTGKQQAQKYANDQVASAIEKQKKK